MAEWPSVTRKSLTSYFRHPKNAALPNHPHARKELNQLSPKSQKYIYIMMDSGTSINAARAKEHFPGCVVWVSAGQLRGEYANTDNGDRL